MVKPLQEVIFRPVDGLWISAEGNVLADFLAAYGYIIDDRCEFARFRDYERMFYVFYRAEARKVKITIWRLG